MLAVGGALEDLPQPAGSASPAGSAPASGRPPPYGSASADAPPPAGARPAAPAGQTSGHLTPPSQQEVESNPGLCQLAQPNLFQLELLVGGLVQTVWSRTAGSRVLLLERTPTKDEDDRLNYTSFTTNFN